VDLNFKRGVSLKKAGRGECSSNILLSLSYRAEKEMRKSSFFMQASLILFAAILSQIEVSKNLSISMRK